MSETASATVDTSTMVQKIAAEALGTFVLVLLGCGTLALAQQGDSFGGVTSVALTFGFVYAALIYALGRVSGGHFNPAVTVGAALGGRVAWREVPVYVGAQLGGAIVGGLSLFVLLQGYESFEAEGAMGQNYFGDDFSGYAWWAAFLLEMLLTALFLYVILAVTDTRNVHPALAPLAIGLTLVALHLFAAAPTGASFNPARSIGPALFAGGDSIIQLWLFILAPLLGAAIAGVTYPLLFGRDGEPVPGSGLAFSRSPKAAPGYGAPDAYQQQWNQNDPYAQYGGAGYGQPPGQAQGYPQGEHQQAPYQQQSWEQAPPQQQPGQQAPIQPAPWEPQAQQWQPEQPGHDDASGQQTAQWEQAAYPQQEQPQRWEQQWERPAGQPAPEAGQPFSPPPVNPAGPDDDEGRTQIRPPGH